MQNSTTVVARAETLGIDVGGVIIDRIANDKSDTAFFGANYLATTAVPNAFEAIAQLVSKRFGSARTFIVSKCGRNIQHRTLEWLEHHNFFKLTGMQAENIRFCYQRHEKAPICHELGITHFIDDRAEVLGYLTTVPHRFLFGSNPQERNRYAKLIRSGFVTPVADWRAVIAQLL